MSQREEGRVCGSMRFPLAGGPVSSWVVKTGDNKPFKSTSPVLYIFECVSYLWSTLTQQDPDSKCRRIHRRGKKKIREYPEQLLVDSGLWVLYGKLHLSKRSCRSGLVKRLWGFGRGQAQAHKPKGILLHLLKVKETAINISSRWGGRQIHNSTISGGTNRLSALTSVGRFIAMT